MPAVVAQVRVQRVAATPQRQMIGELLTLDAVGMHGDVDRTRHNEVEARRRQGLDEPCKAQHQPKAQREDQGRRTYAKRAPLRGGA